MTSRILVSPDKELYRLGYGIRLPLQMFHGHAR